MKGIELLVDWRRLQTRRTTAERLFKQKDLLRWCQVNKYRRGSAFAQGRKSFAGGQTIILLSLIFYSLSYAEDSRHMMLALEFEDLSSSKNKTALIESVALYL